MAPLVTDPIERRLRAARPEAAEVAADAADRPEAAAIRAAARTRPSSELSARAVAKPRTARRLLLRTTVAAALLAVLVIVLGSPAPRSGPEEAVARPIALAIHWFDPPAGTILHVRSTRTGDAAGFMRTGRPAGSRAATTRQESWQSVDQPEQARTISESDGRRVEFGADGIYDAGRNTVYVDVPESRGDVARLKKEMAAKEDPAKKDVVKPTKGDSWKQADAGMRKKIRVEAKRGSGKPGAAEGQPAADPTLAKIRMLLQDGAARVVGRREDNGDETYSIALPGDSAAAPAGGRTVRWTLRVAADGRPQELRIDGGEGSAPLETITWETYEVMPAGSALAGLTTVRGAHPDAAVVRDADALGAAAARLFPAKFRVNVAAPPPPGAKVRKGRP